jgi:hypothetical protein
MMFRHFHPILFLLPNHFRLYLPGRQDNPSHDSTPKSISRSGGSTQPLSLKAQGYQWLHWRMSKSRPPLRLLGARCPRLNRQERHLRGPKLQQQTPPNFSLFMNRVVKYPLYISHHVHTLLRGTDSQCCMYSILSQGIQYFTIT